MGLSTTERRNGIYYNIAELNKIACEWKECKDEYSTRDCKKNLLELIDKCWHGFLGQSSNAGHWLFGSSLGNPISDDPKSPWEVALTTQLEVIASQIRDEENEQEEVEHNFNVLKYCSVSSLLAKDERNIYLIFAHTENLIYYLRRYSDEFRTNLVTLDELISKMQGMCFESFRNNENYPKAYLTHEIIKILYGPSYPYNEEKFDGLTNFMLNNNSHHDIVKTCNKLNLLQVAKNHVSLVHDSSLRNRVSILIKMENSFYNYEHIAKAFREEMNKMFEGNEYEDILNEFNTQKEIFLINKEKEDKKNKEDFDCSINPLNVYGLGGYYLEK